MHIFFALLSAFFAGAVTVIAKLGLNKIDSTVATSVRSIFMTLFLIFVIFITNRINLNEIKNLNFKEVAIIAFSGICGALSWIFYFYALQISKDNTTTIAAIDKLSLVFVFIFALLFLNEGFDLKVLIGILLIVIGSILTIK